LIIFPNMSSTLSKNISTNFHVIILQILFNEMTKKHLEYVNWQLFNLFSCLMKRKIYNMIIMNFENYFCNEFKEKFLNKDHHLNWIKNFLVYLFI
jgi:hypothetical protein